MGLPAPQVWEVWYRRAVNPCVVSMSPPVDITGWTLQFAVLDPADPSADLLVKDTGGGELSILNVGQGVFQVTLTPEDDGLGLIDGYWYQFRRTDAGLEDVLASGPLVMRAR